MAQRKMWIDHSAAGAIVWRDAVTDAPLVTLTIPQFDADDVAVEHVYRYGAAQIVADAGAVDAGTDFGVRIRAMKARVAQIEDGTYRLGARGGLVDGDVFAAMVALELIADTPENRAKWRDAKKAERSKVRARKDVAEYLARNADPDAGDQAVSTIFA